MSAVTGASNSKRSHLSANAFVLLFCVFLDVVVEVGGDSSVVDVVVELEGVVDTVDTLVRTAAAGKPV